MKVVTSFYRRVFVAVRNLSEHTPDPVSSEFKISMLSENDLPFYRKFRPNQSEQIIQHRLEMGDVCCAVWNDDKIVHAGWIATQQPYSNYLNRYIVLSPRSSYLYDGYTLPEYRERGFARLRHRYSFNYLQEKGFVEAFMICAVENHSGYKLLLSAGWKIVGLYTLKKLGPWDKIRAIPLYDYPLPTLMKVKSL
jgi:hypothetical protein